MLNLPFAFLSTLVCILYLKVSINVKLGAAISDHIKLDHWNWVRCQHCDFIAEPNYLSLHIFNRSVVGIISYKEGM